MILQRMEAESQLLTNATYENTSLKNELKDLAKTIPTAPPGTYQIQ